VHLRAQPAALGFRILSSRQPGGRLVKWGRYLPAAGVGEAAADRRRPCSLYFPRRSSTTFPAFHLRRPYAPLDSGGTWRVNNPGVHAAFISLCQSGPPAVNRTSVRRAIYVLRQSGRGSTRARILARYTTEDSSSSTRLRTLPVLSCVPVGGVAGAAARRLMRTHTVNLTTTLRLAKQLPHRSCTRFLCPTAGSYRHRSPNPRVPLPCCSSAEFDLWNST